MAWTVRHKKTATFADEPGAEINKAEWNDTHAVTPPQGLETTDSPTFDTIIMKGMNGLYYKLVIDPDGNIGTELMI